MKTRTLAAMLTFLLLAIAPPRASAQGMDQLPFGMAFGGPFELVDQHGKTRTDGDFRGHYMLIYFGYSSCPDICPLDLSIMAEALDSLSVEGDRVQPIFVTVDPERDTPEVLASYVSAFHPRLIGLTGSEGQIKKVAKAYRVHRRKVVLDPLHAEDYLVDHGSLTYLMGPEGSFLTLIPHNTGAERMAEIIESYLD